MDKNEVQKYLTEDPAGQALLEDLKKPLLKKRDELLGEIKTLGEKHTATAQREADGKKLRISDQEAIRKLVIDDELRRQFKRLGIPITHVEALLAHLKANHDIEVVANGPLREARIGEQKLSDFLNSWAQTDEAKALIPAPANDGGGAPGSEELGDNEVSSFEKELRKSLE